MRGSTRRKKDDDFDTKSLGGDLAGDQNNQKKSSVTSNWRNKLTEKFKKSSTDNHQDPSGEPSLNSYRKTSHELDIQTPMTEPTRYFFLLFYNQCLFRLRLDKAQNLYRCHIMLYVSRLLL